MSKWRAAAKVDKNQPEIVKALRKIPGVTVQTKMDDILIGYKGVNYWIELKESKPSPSQIKYSQYKLWAEWQGQYLIAWELGQILELIGIRPHV